MVPGEVGGGTQGGRCPTPQGSQPPGQWPAPSTVPTRESQKQEEVYNPRAVAIPGESAIGCVEYGLSEQKVAERAETAVLHFYTSDGKEYIYTRGAE